MHNSILKTVLLTIGLMFSNPIFMDFGLQFLASLLIGLILPKIIINPINNIVLKIPGVKAFEDFLSKNDRLKTIVPRIIAGYLFTYIIGFVCLFLGYTL